MAQTLISLARKIVSSQASAPSSSSLPRRTGRSKFSVGLKRPRVLMSGIEEVNLVGPQTKTKRQKVASGPDLDARTPSSAQINILHLPNELLAAIIKEVPLENLPKLSQVNARLRALAGTSYLERAGIVNYQQPPNGNSNSSLSIEIHGGMPNAAIFLLFSSQILYGRSLAFSCDLFTIAEFYTLLAKFISRNNLSSLSIQVTSMQEKMMEYHDLGSTIIYVLSAVKKCCSVNLERSYDSTYDSKRFVTTQPPKISNVQVRQVKKLLNSVNFFHISSFFATSRSHSLQNLCHTLFKGQPTSISINLKQRDRAELCLFSPMSMPKLRRLQLYSDFSFLPPETFFKRLPNLENLYYATLNFESLCTARHTFSVPPTLEALHVTQDIVCDLPDAAALTKLSVSPQVILANSNEPSYGDLLLSLRSPFRRFSKEQLARIQLSIRFPRDIASYVSFLQEDHEQAELHLDAQANLGTVQGVKYLSIQIDTFSPAILDYVLGYIQPFHDVCHLKILGSSLKNGVEDIAFIPQLLSGKMLTSLVTVTCCNQTWNRFPQGWVKCIT